MTQNEVHDLFRDDTEGVILFRVTERIETERSEAKRNDFVSWFRNKNLTAQRSNSNTVWFNFQMYIIFSINLVSQVTLRSSGADIVYGCHLLRCLYNIVRSNIYI
jgi:hypothetical protein